MGWQNVTGLFRWKRGSLRRRFLVWGLTLLGLALTINTIIGSTYTRRQMKRDVAQVQMEIASRVAHEIGEFIRRKVDRLSDLAASASLHELGKEEQRLLALLLLKNDRSFTEISVLDDKGTEVVKVSERKVYLPTELSDQSETDKFTKAIRGENYISPVYTSDKAEPYVTIAVPVKITPQLFVGVVSAEANLKVLWEVIGEVKFGNAGYGYLVDSRGDLVAHRDPSLVLKRTNLNHVHAVQEFLRYRTAADPTPAYEGRGITGEPVLGTYVPVGELGWAVILEEPLAAALGELKRMERYFSLLLGVGLLVGAAIIVWASSQITGPIQELHQGVEVIGAGNLDHRVEIKTGDEIEQLAREFNKMAGQLQTSYATLEEKVESRTRELSVLYEVAASVSRSLDIDTVLSTAIGKVLEVLRFDAGCVYLLDREGKELLLKVHRGIKGEAIRQIPVYRIGQGINGKVAETGEALLFEDIESDPRYQQLAYTELAKWAGCRAVAVFPIKVREKVLGTIDLLGLAPRSFLANEVQLISSVADQIGVAIDNASLFEETARKADELSALYDVTATVSQSLEAEQVLQQVIKKITEIFGFDTTRIFLFDDRRESLDLRASFETDPEFWMQVRHFVRGQGFIGRVAESGEAIVIENVWTDPRYQQISHTKATQRAGLSFLCAFPIKVKEKTLGTMLCQGREPRHLAPEDVRLLTSMAEQIGIAVENVSLFQEVKTKSQELAALVEINRDIAGLLNRDVLLPRIAEEARRILNVDCAIFRLVEGDDLVLLTASDPVHDFMVQPRLSIREGLSGQVVLQNRVVAVGKLLEDHRLAHWQREALSRAGYHSFLGIPMRVANCLIGVLTLFSEMEREFRPEEIGLMTAFADQATIAIQNANLFAEVKQKTTALERANQELIESGRVKSEFMAAMSHELRTPLSVIVGNADLIRDLFFGEITPKQRNSLEKILRYSQMLLKLINDVLAMTRLEAKKMSMDISTFHLDGLMEHIRAYAEQLNYNNYLEVLWTVEENLPAITTDALKLEEIFQNLIGNAFKFTPHGTIEVRVRDLPGKGRIEFCVADTGVGIGREAMDKIFDEFYQQKDAHTGSHSGVGLGLSIVKKYLEMMQGEIRVESQPQKGSTFTFTLPYAIANAK